MKELWKASAGKFRPVAVLFGVMVTLIYIFTVFAIERVGDEAPIIELWKSDVPSDIRQASMELREHDKRMYNIGVLAHLLMGGFIGFISVLCQPSTPNSTDIIKETSDGNKRVLTADDLEKQELKGQLNTLQKKVDDLKESFS